MANIEIIEALGNSICRGREKNCCYKYPKKITKGTKCLRIHIYGAGGHKTAFYCNICMLPILEQFKNCLMDP